MADEKIILTELDVKTDEAVSDVIKLKEEIKVLSAQTKKAKDEQGELSAEYIQYSAALKSAQSQLRTQENLLQKLTTAQISGKDSREQMAAEYAAISVKIGQLSKEELTNTEAGQKMTARAKELKAQIIELDKSVLNGSSNVGLYEESIKNATEGMAMFQGGAAGVASNMLKLSNSEGGIKGFFSTFVGGIGQAIKMSLLFIATPIGAVIAAIVAGIALITAAIKGNQDEADKFEKVWAGVKATIDVVIGSVIKLGSGLIEFLRGNFKSGIDKMTHAFDGMSDAIEEAYKNGVKLKQMQIDLEKAQNDSIITMQKLQAEQDKLNMAAGDNTRSLKSQQQAALQLGKVKKEQAKIAYDLAKQELAIEEEKLNQKKKNNGSISREDQKLYNEAVVRVMEANSQIINIEAESAKQRREISQDLLQRKLDLIVDGYDSYKTLNEKIVNDDTQTLEIRQKHLDDIRARQDKAFKDEFDAISKFTGKKIDGNKLLMISDSEVLANEVNNLGVSDVNAGRILEMIKERRAALGDFADDQKTLDQAVAENAVANMNFEILKWQDAYNTRKNQRIADFDSYQQYLEYQKKGVQANIDFENEQYTKQLEVLKTQRDAKLINETEYAQQSYELEKGKNENIAQINKDFRDEETNAKIEAAKTDFDNQMAIAESTGQSLLQLKRQQLKQQENEEIKAAKKNGADIQLIKQKYAAADRALTKATTAAQLSVYSNLSNSLSGLFEENTTAAKVAATAQATINTYLGATAAFAQTPGDIIIKSLAAAAALATGFVNVRKIWAVDTSGGSATTDSSSSTSTSMTQAVTSTMTAASYSVGNGIVSRSLADSTYQNQTSDKILVVDDVTAKQIQNSSKIKAQTY